MYQGGGGRKAEGGKNFQTMLGRRRQRWAGGGWQSQNKRGGLSCVQSGSSPNQSPNQGALPSSLKLALLNARNKTSLIRHVIADEEIGLACIPETWVMGDAGNLTPGFSVWDIQGNILLWVPLLLQQQLSLANAT